MSWGFGWRPYVPVAQRRARAARELAKLAKKTGQTASPVLLDGRRIAGTFWGKAWCDNLEAYSDFANRLPRGRAYVRNGSVIDLQISRGKVTARVAGSSLYHIEINIKPLAANLWKSIQTECAGKIDSLLELLQGKLSASVMQIVTRSQHGLFPTPKEIDLDCSCPDWADLCKHVAASLYGVGARLDHRPELLVLLRGVDPADLISRASATEAVRQSNQRDGATVMSETEIADVFGIELADATPAANQANQSVPESRAIPNAPAPAAPVAKPKTKPPKRVRTKVGRATGAKRVKTAPAQPSRRTLSVAARNRIIAAQKARWAALKSSPRLASKHPKAK
jgi:uncharacterized Zn finger protein